MFKKVHICKPEGKSSTVLETEAVRCSICDGVPSKFVKRGHLDSATPTRKNGDSMTQLQHGGSNMKVSRCMGPNQINAGGDHRHCSKCFRTIPNSKSLNNIDTTGNPIHVTYSPSKKESKASKTNNYRNKYLLTDTHKETMEAMVQFKNVNFRDSETLLSYSGMNEKEAINNYLENVLDVIHRPITCPVTECRKMIARASVLQHFYFDHSKIPRMRISISEVQSVFIDGSAITKDIRCFAVFILQTNASLVHTTDSDSLMNGAYKNASFLLMGVRMQSAETIKKRGEDVSIRDAQTQTEVQSRSSKPLNKDVYSAERCLVHQHDTIILWTYKLDDNSFYYNISLRNPDKKLGYSFTGKPLYVGDLLYLQEIYDAVDSLRILEKASSKLMNEQNELEVAINIFK